MMAWLCILLFLLSALVTGLLKAHAQRTDLMDYPNSRSAHKAATPSGGGLAIVFIFLVSATVHFFQGDLDNGLFYSLVISGGLVAAVGYVDDHIQLHAKWRILIHFIAAGLVVYWLVGSAAATAGPKLIETGLFVYLVGGIALVWLLNLFNFMDGIDGIAASELVFVLGAAALISYDLDCGSGIICRQQITLYWEIIAVTLGFLVWNWPPAKIFMGDVGSGFMGLILGVFATHSIATGTLPIWSWVILLGVFITDASVTLIRRIISRQRWYEAHNQHAYQHAARRFKSHGKITGSVMAINLIWLLPLAWAAASFPENAWLFTLLAIVPLVIISIRFKAGTSR